jgi:hypothetical protein
MIKKKESKTKPQPARSAKPSALEISASFKQPKEPSALGELLNDKSLKEKLDNPPKLDNPTPQPIPDTTSPPTPPTRTARGYLTSEQVDPELVLSLAKIYCTQEEIASVVGCSLHTLRAHFSDLVDEGHASARSTLRREMWRNALKGDTQMQIWLSKNWLDYKDRKDDQAAVTNFNVVVHEVPSKTIELKKIGDDK